MPDPIRKRWKAAYRQFRIIRRETRKAQLDMMCFGTGYVYIGPNAPDYIKHIPAPEIYNA